jgi:WD40 repeat protein
MLRFAFKPRHPVTRVAFTADGQEVVTAQPFTGVAVRNRLTGVARVAFATPRAAVISSLAVHPVAGWIVVYSSTAAALLEASSGTSLPISELGPHGYQLAPQMLAASSMWWKGSTTGDNVTLFTRTRTAPMVMRGSRAAVTNCPLRNRHFVSQRAVAQFAPDGTKLALGDGESLSVFDLSPLDGEPTSGSKRQSIDPLLTLERPDPTAHGTFADKQAEHWLPPVAFDHAGRSLFTLGLRNRVRRIDLATGGVMSEWGWRCEPIRSLAVAPDDLTAAAGCQRGELVLWDLE